MTETDDTESLERLMRLAQQGDKKAYATLFRTIIPLLRALISRRLSNTADMEDVVQDILLSLHRASHTYNAGRSFKIWMNAIARHRLNDHLRWAYKKEALIEIGLDDLTLEIPSADVTENRDRNEYIIKMLDSLPEKQKQILMLMKLEGYSAVETAATMKMSVSAVKVAAHRAYKTLAANAKREQES